MLAEGNIGAGAAFVGGDPGHWERKYSVESSRVAILLIIFLVLLRPAARSAAVEAGQGSSPSTPNLTVPGIPATAVQAAVADHEATLPVVTNQHPGRTPDGRPSSQGRQYKAGALSEVVVTPSWWRAWGMRGLLVGIVVGGLLATGAAISTRRMRLRLREAQREQALSQERERAGEALRLSEERYRAVLSNSSLVTFSTDAQGVFTLSEGQALSRLGLKPGEVVGLSAFELYGGYPQIIACLKQALAGEEVRAELTVQGLVFETNFTPLLGPGRTVQGVIGVANDITERKRAEALRTVMYEVTEAVPTSSDLRELYASIHRSLGRLMNVRNFFVALRIPGMPNRFAFPYAADEREPYGPVEDLEGGLTAYVVRTGRPALVDGETYRRLIAAGELKPIGTPAEIWLGVPLTVAGEVIGVVALQSYDDPYLYNEKHVELLSFISTQIALATDRKRTQDRLRQLDHAIASTTTGVLIADAREPDLPVVYVNPAFTRITGYSREEALGRNCRFLEGQDRAQPALHDLRAALRDGHPCVVSLRNYRKDGTLFWNELSIAPVSDASGTITHFIGVQTDITARRAAEIALKESGERLATALAGANLGTWDWDVPSGRVHFDQRWTEMIGYDQAEIEPHFRAWEELVHPADRAGAMVALQAHLEERAPFYEAEFRLRHKRGNYLWILAKGRVIERDQQGYPQRVSGTHLDLTARRQAEQEIRELNQELERRVADRTAQLATANKELESFCYSVSHDLRAPLRAIEGFSQILLEDCAALLPPENRDHLQRVRTATLHMAQLIDGLLDLSRMTRTDLQKTTVNLSELAREIVGQLQRGQPERGVVEVSIQPGLRTQADPVLARAVMENLLGNAWKYTRRQPNPRIEFLARQDDGETVFEVRDNGIGFNMAHAGKLFGAFQRLHPNQEFEGTGVGLASVHRILHRHGGWIQAEAAPDRGATFSFSFGSARSAV